MRHAVRTRRLGSGLVATALVAPGALVLVASGALATPAVRAQATGAVKATATNKFEPATINVATGATVTWTNEGGFHTVTGGENGTPDSGSPMNGTLASAGATYAVKFDKPGRYPYFCSPHVSVGMVGEVVVGGAAGGGGSPAPTLSASVSPSPVGERTPQPQEPGGSESPATEIPGTGDDNRVLKEIEEQEAAKKKQIGGFNTLLAGIVAATLALAVAVFASTRPRRSGR